jgi:hypothetical protein
LEEPKKLSNLGHLKGQFALNQRLKLDPTVYGDSESSWALPRLLFADKKKVAVDHIMCVCVCVYLAFTAFMLVFTPAIIWLF